MYNKLISLFKDWNSKINLSAIRDDDWIKIKHIEDSLVGNKILHNLFDKNDKILVCDVGTWSGFPLLPLAIENPNWDFISIESVKKKVNAVKDIAEKLGLKNIKFIWDRAEKVKNIKADVVTARAVAYIDKLLKFIYHLVKKWWYFVLYKLDSPEEYEDIKKMAKKYNLDIKIVEKYKLFPDDITRVIYVLQKK